MCRALKYGIMILFGFVLLYQPVSSYLASKDEEEVSNSPLLQALSHQGILQTKQIKIPGYPHAFNPSIIRYQDGYLLSFRLRKSYRGSQEKAENRPRQDRSFIGIAKLDHEFNVCNKSVQLVDVHSYSGELSSTAEDARLLTIGDQIFVFFNDLPFGHIHNGFAMYVAELVEKDGVFAFKESAKPLNYANVIPINYANTIPIEKNWMPFLSQRKVHMIYSDEPRIILEVDLSTGNCKEVSHTTSNGDWKWGEIRGGTPASLIGDKSLTFFHSVVPASAIQGKLNKKQRHIYVMGAYTFDPEPPFTIRSMTSVPLGELKDYTEDNPRKVVFPAGMVIEDDLIHVAWGKSDKWIWITTFDKTKLLNSMESLTDN